MTSQKSTSIVVVGAGIIGLTTAIELLERRPDTKCTIIAEHLPGDEKSTAESGSQGAHHVSHATGKDKDIADIDRETFGVFMKQIADGVTPTLMEIDQFEYYLEGADNGSDPEGLALCRMPELRDLTPSELPPDVLRGVTFKTFTINTPLYLVYLADRFRQLGGGIVRGKVAALADLLNQPDLVEEPSVIINCTGLGAAILNDVKDDDMFPTRGQLCVIRAPWMKYGKTFIGKGWTSYTIPRSNGQVIVGGTREANDWHDKPRPETSKTILERAVKFDRTLLPADKRESGTYLDLDLIEEGCGRRPYRKGGFRLELSEIEGATILHHYGHGGAGYQNSWACARRAIDLLLPAIQA